MDLLQEVLDHTSQAANHAVTMAPILGAAGIDFEEAEINNKYRAKRAAALLNLIQTLVNTEKEVKEFKEKKLKQVKTNQELKKMFGL